MPNYFDVILCYKILQNDPSEKYHLCCVLLWLPVRPYKPRWNHRITKKTEDTGYRSSHSNPLPLNTKYSIKYCCWIAISTNYHKVQMTVFIKSHWRTEVENSNLTVKVLDWTELLYTLWPEQANLQFIVNERLLGRAMLARAQIGQSIPSQMK